MWRSPSDPARHAAVRRMLPYAGSAALISAGFGARFLLRPMFGENHPYTAFYPSIVIIAYAFGRRFAAVSTVVAASLALVFFTLPTLDKGEGAGAVAAFLFFCANCAVAIWIITELVRSLKEVKADQGRTEALASAQADMFRDLNERLGHHLQLVSGVLALQAHGEPQPQVSDALAKASERSLLLARVHREVTGRASGPVDLTAVAARLMASLLASRGQSPGLIELEGPPVHVSDEDATSLAVALLECAARLLPPDSGRPLRISLARGAGSMTFRVAERDPQAGSALAELSDAYLLRAAVSQMQGRLRVVAGEAGSVVELTFPLETGEPAPAGTLH
jgi:hypothetical protein